MNTEDKKLLKLIKLGDSSCFELLYHKYKGKVYHFIFNLSGGDRYLAEEIAQNVFVKIWESRETIVPEGSFSAFLYTVSKNMFCNYLRKQAQQAIYEMHIRDHTRDFDRQTEQEIEYKLLEAEIDKLIEKLPPARREVYLLSKKKHYSNKDIARFLNISEKTVESHLLTASKFIRKALALKLGI